MLQAKSGCRRWGPAAQTATTAEESLGCLLRQRNMAASSVSSCGLSIWRGSACRLPGPVAPLLPAGAANSFRMAGTGGQPGAERQAEQKCAPAGIGGETMLFLACGCGSDAVLANPLIVVADLAASGAICPPAIGYNHCCVSMIQTANRPGTADQGQRRRRCTVGDRVTLHLHPASRRTGVVVPAVDPPGAPGTQGGVRSGQRYPAIVDAGDAGQCARGHPSRHLTIGAGRAEVG